jgi:hypothetical protein
MKTTTILTAALIGALPTLAAAWGLPAHVQNGYRDTGCDASAAKPIAGSNAVSNPTCPNAEGGMDAEHPAYNIERDPVVEAPGEDDPAGEAAVDKA